MTSTPQAGGWVERCIELCAEACEASWSAGETQVRWEPHASKRNAMQLRLREELEAQAAITERLAEALKCYLNTQDALDNRELQGPNVEDYFEFVRRRNAARRDLDAAIAKDKP